MSAPLFDEAGASRALNRGGRRGEILAEATRLFARHGFNGVGMRAIADAVGVQTSSLYHYFPAKTDILYEIVLDSTAAFIDGRLPVLAGTTSPAATLREVFHEHILYFHENREEEAVALREMRELEAARYKEVNDMRRGYQDAICKVVVAGQKSGQFRVDDPMVATLACLGLLNSVNDWYRIEGRLSIEQVAQAYSSMAVDRILGARKSPRRRST